MPNTMVAKKPPMNPSHVFLGDSCRGHSQGMDTRLIHHYFNVSTENGDENNLLPLYGNLLKTCDFDL